MSKNFHETFGRKNRHFRASDRSFCLLMTGVFAAVATYQGFRGHGSICPYASASLAFLILGLAKPALVRRLNVAWGHLGEGLSVVTNTLLLAAIFSFIVTPTGLMMRLVGKDPLRRRYDLKAESYWIIRDPSGPAPDNMTNQF